MLIPPFPSRGADRRTALRLSARALAALSVAAPWWAGALAQPVRPAPSLALPMTAPINTRPIPSTGEALPVIGCGASRASRCPAGHRTSAAPAGRRCC
ncbi:hypothetical protein [Polaromonas sp. CG_9.2]|uniref:hypothetical protein n=1 Tax=Polaromonas sp. CG_9.2 TaxID=2787731 RepID=UPI0018CB3FDA|nr:hypothetical protein [Polaromonas sp. CG_9.2]MBG6113312.1 hypothetical protein [Polaromonas sp. CG_9.2]MDH6183233.1 hypothetical protein [Polaromonas sp. CG_23.6]